jgi:hypothetical protein
MRGKMRRLLTGHEDRRIRDLLDEKKKQPHNVKLIDKFLFTFWVFNISIYQYFMLNKPEDYWIYHVVSLSILLLIRLYVWRQMKWHYFLLDFCYFTNLWLLVCCLFRLDERLPSFYRAAFICSVGPLPLAILVWRISLVFHEYEKVTSVLVHILPMMLCYAMRWGHIHGDPRTGCLSAEERAVADDTLRITDFVIAGAGYLFWQTLYYVKTEVVDRHLLDKDLSIQTSLRMLSTDRKNDFAAAVLAACRRIGIMKNDEFFDPTTAKTKAIFISTQFIYTILTFCVAPFVYYSRIFHLVFIGFIFWVSTYNGAQYYIEIFSKRYQQQFKDSEDFQRVVQAAAEVAFDSGRHVHPTSGTNGKTSPESTQLEEDIQRQRKESVCIAAKQLANEMLSPAPNESPSLMGLPFTAISAEPVHPLPSSSREDGAHNATKDKSV